MNDLERDLREVFHEDARRVPSRASAPEGLRRSAHRRQAVFVGLMGLAGAAVIAGVVAGATTLLSLRGGPEPAAPGPTTTGTMNGITITYPQSWRLIDPDTAALNGSPMMGESPLPRIVLALAPTQAPETFGCPALAAEGDAAPLLMTIQEEPLALNGPASTPWPVELQPMNVDASESGCYPDWEFLRAGWTASDRTFEARVGFSPDASNDERDALFAAFASMTFEPSDRGITAVVLGQGVAGGEPWTLSAQRMKEGLTLSLEAPPGGVGTSIATPPSSRIQASRTTLGHGSDRELVAFGTISIDVVRLEATSSDGTVLQGEVFDIPDELGSNAKAFFIAAPPGTVEIRGYDVSGQVVARGSIATPGASPTGST